MKKPFINIQIFTKRLHVWRLAFPIWEFQRIDFYGPNCYCTWSYVAFGHAVHWYKKQPPALEF